MRLFLCIPLNCTRRAIDVPVLCDEQTPTDAVGTLFHVLRLAGVRV
jgi:hypothetical protein